MTEADVDHFVPFSQYPRDLAHNFVLAHPACNRSKSDTLAAGPHLERWLERIGRRGDTIAEIGMAAGMLADAQVSRKIAAWGYTTAITWAGVPGLSQAVSRPLTSGTANISRLDGIGDKCTVSLDFLVAG